MSNELARLQRVWNELGADDPLWAVLSSRDKRGSRWNVEEFLATGRVEIENQLGALASHALPHRRSSALDFGCGAGRLTRALATHFDHVIGLDIAASMVSTARRLNSDIGNVEFRENPSPRLDSIADASIDLVFSSITLQHIPEPLALGYVAEFLRVLGPGGAVVFQFVSGYSDDWRGRLHARIPNRWLNPLRRLAWRRWSVFEMHTLDVTRLRELLAQHPQIHLLADVSDGSAGRGWIGRRWYLTRSPDC